MRNFALYSLLGLAVAAGAWTSFELLGPKTPLPRYENASIGGNFTLNSAQGEVSLDSLKGEVVLVFFGFMSCPDVCPTSMAVMRQAFNELKPNQREKVRGLFVSVDPQRDTVEELEAFVRFFSDRLVGLTGTQAQIDALVKQYGAYYQYVKLEDSALGYTVDHSARVYLIDPEGRLADILAHDINPDELRSKLEAYL